MIFLKLRCSGLREISAEFRLTKLLLEYIFFYLKNNFFYYLSYLKRDLYSVLYVQVITVCKYIQCSEKLKYIKKIKLYLYFRALKP